MNSLTNALLSEKTNMFKPLLTVVVVVVDVIRCYGSLVMVVIEVFSSCLWSIGHLVNVRAIWSRYDWRMKGKRERNFFVFFFFLLDVSHLAICLLGIGRYICWNCDLRFDRQVCLFSPVYIHCPPKQKRNQGLMVGENARQKRCHG